MHHVRLFFLYLPITMLLPALLTLYVGRKLVSTFGNASLRVLLGSTVLFPLGLLASLSLMFWAEQDRVAIGWFLEPGFLFLGYLLTVVPLLFTTDLVRIAWDGISRFSKTCRNLTATVKTKPIAYAYWAIALLALVLCLWGQHVAETSPMVTTHRLPIAALSSSLEGYRILQLTDVHLRSRKNESALETLVARTNALKPDLIALTGDIVDGPMDNLRARLRPLGQLHAPDGVWVVLGNHEYYADAEACVTEFERLGFTVLLDEHRVIHRTDATLTIAGVTIPKHGMHGSKWSNPSDRLARCDADPRVALRGVPANSVKLLLAHQPESLIQARGLDFDLGLAGHVHGGGFFPWTWFTEHLERYRSGLRREGKAWIFVGRGIGTFGPKLRLGATPEVTVIQLTTQH
jgi:predicted MPP superfamily phosphohydrolase